MGKIKTDDIEAYGKNCSSTCPSLYIDFMADADTCYKYSAKIKRYVRCPQCLKENKE